MIDRVTLLASEVSVRMLAVLLVLLLLLLVRDIIHGRVW